MAFIPFNKPFITEEEIIAVQEVLRSGWLTTGPKTAEFEQKMCDYISPNVSAVALSSCTAGLFLALQAFGIRAGDEVIVPSITFIATSHVVKWCGADFKICDICPDNFNLDCDKLAGLITNKTRAIIPVHLAGYPCDLQAIERVIAGRNIAIIQDAAHAVGSSYYGEKIGTHADCTVFSFYATKNIACGEGGMLLSPHRELVEKVRQLMYFGIDKQAFQRYSEKGNWFYDVTGIGYKYNLDDLHSALGIVQLAKLEMMNQKRTKIAEYYRKNLHNSFIFPDYHLEHVMNWHLFALRLPKHKNRDLFLQRMKEVGVGCSVHFIPLYYHSCYAQDFSPADFPQTEQVFQGLLSLPLYPSMSDAEVEIVVERANQILLEL